MKAIAEADAAQSNEFESARSDRISFIAIIASLVQQATAALAGRRGVVHGVAGHHDSQYRGANDRGRTPRCSAQHEVGAGKLHLEPCDLHSHQRLDGGPLRNAPCLRLRDRHFHPRVISLRHVEQYPRAGRLPHPARLRRIHDGPCRPPHLSADIRQIRTGSRHEFVSIPALIAPMLGPIAGGLIVGYLQWRFIFFVNIPLGLVGLYLVYRHLPDYREHTDPLDVTGLILFGSGVALLSYVLEVFGEHTLNAPEILGLLGVSIVLLAGYGFHATRTAHPLLRLALFRIRTFRAAAIGSFGTRLGIGGIPFLFPLLYQVGLGFTPIQSGLLMIPQAIASMSLKPAMPRILARFGYRAVLVSNTLLMGVQILLFAHIGKGTPVWLIVIEVFFFGFFTSLQYTSMNTLVYADVNEQQASGASSIASTVQQMSVSFAVALASLVTAFFIPDRHTSSAPQFIHGIHRAFLVLGGMTILSTIVFRELKRGDGDAVSQAKGLHAG